MNEIFILILLTAFFNQFDSSIEISSVSVLNNYDLPCNTFSSSSHCLNEGICNSIGECVCRQPFTGLKCESLVMEISCGLKICNNGADCIRVLDKNGDYQCKCNPNSNQTVCETQLNINHKIEKFDRFGEKNFNRPCNEKIKCLNGGTCLPAGECVCPYPFAGFKCDSVILKINCGPVLCFKAHCQSLIGNYSNKCICDQSYTVESCETKFQEKISPLTNISIVPASTSKQATQSKINKEFSSIIIVLLILITLIFNSILLFKIFHV